MAFGVDGFCFIRSACYNRSHLIKGQSMMTIRSSVGYAWLVWAFASLFLFYKYLLQVSPAVMVHDLMQHFALSGALIGNLAAGYFYAYLVMQLPTGIVLDRYSPRYVVTISILICAVGAIVFAWAPNYDMAFLGRVLIGIGGAFSAVGAMKLITIWFDPSKFALMSGLMVSVGMLGAVGGEAPISALLNHLTWQQTSLYCGVAGLVFAFLFWLLIKDKVSTPVGEVQGPILKSLCQVMRLRQSWVVAIYSGLAFAPISAFGGFWGIPFLMQNDHLHKTSAAFLLSLIFVGFGVGTPLAGWLSDRIHNRKRVMASGTFLAMVLLIVLIYVPALSAIEVGVLVFLIGFFIGCFFVSFAMIKEINSPLVAGTAIGFINMFNALFGALTEPLVGHVIDSFWQGHAVMGVRVFSDFDYQMGMSILPVGMLVALILICFIRETHGKQVQG